MKRPFFLLALLALSGSRLALGQAPHSVGLEVQPVSAGATVQSGAGSMGSSYGSSNVRTTSAKEALQVKLRNFGAVPTAAKVQWYFVAVPRVLEPGKPAEDQEFVFDQGGQDVTLAGGATQTLSAVSAEVTSTKKLSGGRSSSRRSSGSASSKPKETGSALRGWMVRVVVDGKTVATRGSTQTYEEIAEDEESLQDLLNGAPPQEARKKKKK